MIKIERPEIIIEEETIYTYICPVCGAEFDDELDADKCLDKCMVTYLKEQEELKEK